MMIHDAGPSTATRPVPSRAQEVSAAVERACARIAPTWPLDRFIAVNPFWELTGKPLPSVASDLAALSGARMLMPRAWYAEQWRRGRIRPEHLREATARHDGPVTEERLVDLLQSPEPRGSVRPRVVDIADTYAPVAGVSWHELVVQRTSQFCASYFDEGQAQLGPTKTAGLYRTWRRHAAIERGPAILMGEAGYRAAVEALPHQADEAIVRLLEQLGVPSEERERYLAALLLDVNGWASWCAYLRWTARLAGGDDRTIVDLLAIRLAWEGIVHRLGGDALRAEWRRAVAGWAAVDKNARSARKDDWLLQEALESGYQQDLCGALKKGFRTERPAHPRVQAVFCIDVRSEVFRRALEAEDARIQTIGFAGFFGLPIAYAPLGSESARPQLPGLLAPKYLVTDACIPEGLDEKRRERLSAASAWKAFRTGAVSSFAFVESLGVFYAAKLASDMFAGSKPRALRQERAGLSNSESEARKPRLTGTVDGQPITDDERARLAEGMLRAMSLTKEFAPLILFVGHGSDTRNNPHSAALDCGACCGQTGEVNARVAAALLNDAAVRERLRARGIDVPSTTCFVAAVHCTTTDRVVVFDESTVPATHARELHELREGLARAGARARRERAPKLGLAHDSDRKLHAALRDRARSWAAVRPEWGLARNASFIVAPRERTRELNLDGRAFLHDYRFEEDDNFATLELLMTAPVVVTHWINFQYYASTVDNDRYGSGNKVLHNVVGGRLGVFEGNAGDLRVGLPMQCLHDGERWVHEPLRLSVFIEAPRAAIDVVLFKHAKVRELVDNRWLHLFQLDRGTRSVHARHDGAWRETGRP